MNRLNVFISDLMRLSDLWRLLYLASFCVLKYPQLFLLVNARLNRLHVFIKYNVSVLVKIQESRKQI